MKLKVAILGMRGIPNYYGGFEHIAEYVSAGLVNKGYDITFSQLNWNWIL